MQKIFNILNNNLYALSLYARQAAGTIILLLIARYLSVYDYGLFSSYKNIATFWFMFANMGFTDYVLVSSKANPREVNLKISLFIINAIFIAILMIFGTMFLKLSNHLLFSLVVIRTFFDYVFFTLILPCFQAAKKFNSMAITNIAYSLGVALIALISYIYKLSLAKFLILNIILGLINFIQCSFYIKINYFLLFNNFIRYFKMLDKSIFAYVGVTVAYYLYSQVSSLFVSTTQPKEEAALYFAAFTIANIVNLILNAQIAKIMPDLIKNSVQDVKAIINKNLKNLLMIMSLIFVGMIFIGKFILHIFYGQTYYTNAYPILLILMLGNILVAEAAIYGAYITASGNQKQKIPMQLEATSLTILGLIILHKFGIYGAAFSFLFATIYISYRYTTFAIKLIKNNTNG